MSDQLNVWQDREIKFDANQRELECRPGEFVIDRLNSVEDTKGNSGDSAIGLNCILSINTKPKKTKMNGVSDALYILSKHNGVRFEFIFTYLVPGSPRMFQSIMSVHRAYESSKLYREVKLRGALMNKGQLKHLPKEQLYNKINGVWNLSSEQGNLGTFYLTNIRVVWHGNMNENFNVSIPYLQMKAVKIRDSKFGVALVIETLPTGGNYVLGFKIDPEDKLKDTLKEISSLYKVYSNSPLFGVDFELEDQTQTFEQAQVAQAAITRKNDDVEIEQSDEHSDTFAAYYALDKEETGTKDVEYNEDVGLLTEKLKSGYKLKNLWDILNG